MRVLLTGGTGFVGSSVLPALLRHGHSVLALARSDAAAERLERAGAITVRGDLTDTDALLRYAREADGVIHVASPGDATSGLVDAGVAAAFVAALTDSDKPYVHTGGVWVLGDTHGLVDAGAPFDPPALTAWRLPVEAKVLESTADGVRSMVVAPGIVYGYGAGLPNLIVQAPRRNGTLLYPGPGDQHWATVHVDDLAELYVAALERGEGGSFYLGVNGDTPTVRELAEAASRAAGLGGAVAPEPREETVARLGPLAEALFLDQQVTGAATRQELGWQPAGPSLLTELESGSYAPRTRPAGVAAG